MAVQRPQRPRQTPISVHPDLPHPVDPYKITGMANVSAARHPQAAGAQSSVMPRAMAVVRRASASGR